MDRFWNIFLVILFNFALSPTANADQLGQLQMQNSSSQKGMSGNGFALQAIDLLQGKLNSGDWILGYPESSDVIHEKPRVSLRVPYTGSSKVYVPRWEILKKMSGGACQALPTPELSFSASLLPGDCPDDGRSFEVDGSSTDGSAVASLQVSPSVGEEQGGFLAVQDLEPLSLIERNDIFQNVNFSHPKEKLKVVRLSFVGYVPSSDGTGQIEGVQVNVGGLLLAIPVRLVKPLQYVESGTGRIMGVELRRVPERTLTSSACPTLTPEEVGCTGLGSANCAQPNSAAAKVQKLFCKPASGTLGNFIVSTVPAGLAKVWLSNFGTLYNGSGEVIRRDYKIISIVAQNGSLYALRSDGVLLKGTDVNDAATFSPVSCVNLERAESLVPSSPELSTISCL